MNQSSIIILFFALSQAHSLLLSNSSFQNDNSNDQEGWNIVNKISAATDSSSQCGGSSIFGGYQIFGHLTIITNLFSLQPHSKIRITFNFWKDDWGTNQKILLYVDDNIIDTNQDDNSGIQQCGGASNDQMIQIDQTINHNFKTALVVILTDFTSASGFWGINDFNLYIEECPIGCIICNAGDSYMMCQFWTLSYESLTGITEADFKTEGWQVTNNKQGPSLCSNIPLLCGYDKCGQNIKIIKELLLATHSKIKIHFRYFKIDSWDGEKAILRIDNIQKWSKSYHFYDGYQICGRTNWDWNELGIFIEQNIPHNKKQLNIEITSGLNQEPGDESFGLRDVQLFIYNKCDYLYYDECCGDQYKSYDEDCDDGNINPFDGCHNCKYSCVEGCELCIKGICYTCMKGWMYNEFFYICELDNVNIVQNKQVEYLIPRLCQEHCQICIQSLCLKCFDDYYLNQLTNTCDSICGDSIQNGNEQCDDGNNYIYDGCYNCQLIQYNNCNNQCQICYFETCQSCIQGYSLQNNECISICGDNIVNKNLNEEGKPIEQCDNTESDGCLNCIIQPNYICLKEDQSICWTCDELCSKCVIDHDNLKCLECPQGYFPKGINCQICLNNCVTCRSERDLCTSCFRYDCEFCENIQGLYTDHKSGKCLAQCGDGILIKDQEKCDDGNIENGDGCDSQCNIEYSDDEVSSIKENKTYEKNEVQSTNTQKSQAETIEGAYSSFTYLIYIIAILSIIFSLFDYFFSILELLSWINQFYFLNVQYPFNVETLFKNCDWSSFINIPTYSQLNQRDCEYYFQSPTKFMNQGIDPLFINNVQIPLIFILLSITSYLLAGIALSIVTFLDYILQKEINPKSSNPFKLFKLQNNRQQTVQNTQQTVPNQQSNIKCDIQTTLIVRNTKIVKILNKLQKLTKSLKMRVKSTISLSLLDIALAIILQLLFATEFQYNVIFINELLAAFACLFVYYQLYQSYKILNIHQLLAECPKFKLIYGSFYEGLNTEKKFGYIYQLVYFIRKILYIFFTVAFYYNPVLQTSTCFMTFATGVILLLYQNPYETKKQYIQHLMSEFSVSLILLITILFAFNDQTNKFSIEVTVILGWIIIALILMSLISEVLTLIYEILLSFYTSFMSLKEFIKKAIRYFKGQQSLPEKNDLKQEKPNNKPEENPNQKRLKFIPSNGRLHQVSGIVRQN